MQRRTFIKNTGLTAAAFAAGSSFEFAGKTSNPLPEWHGFNLLDFYSPDPSKNHRTTTEEHFKWMRGWGFDFVRIPIAYPCYLTIDRTKDITAEDVHKINDQAVNDIDSLVQLAHKHDLHTS